MFWGLVTVVVVADFYVMSSSLANAFDTVVNAESDRLHPLLYRHRVGHDLVLPQPF